MTIFILCCLMEAYLCNASVIDGKVISDFSRILNQASAPVYKQVRTLDERKRLVDQKIHWFEMRGTLSEKEREHKEKLEELSLQMHSDLNAAGRKLERTKTLQQSFVQYNFFPEFKEEQGEYNPQAIMPDEISLPEFGRGSMDQSKIPEDAGGISASDNPFAKACPALVDGVISSVSAMLQNPVQGAWLSAGTWSYPSGGMHLGADYAIGMYSPVYAPANGLILYADTPVDSSNGYLGNYCGWPYGGGNTLAMICAVEDMYYGVTFSHLSSQIYVKAGAQVQQGMIIALSGNSGNSTGPHVHVEVFAIHSSFEEAVNAFKDGADFSFQTGWSTPAACSAIACRVRPEEVFVNG